MTLAKERAYSTAVVQSRSAVAGGRAAAKHRFASLAGILALAAALAGCSVPLTAANAPLAAAFWIPLMIAMLDDKTANSEALLLGEVRQSLTPDAVAAGRLDPDSDRVEDLPGLLTGLGITQRQVQRGQVLALRVGMRTSEGSSVSRGVYFPVLRADVAAAAGNIVEFRLRRERPPELVLSRAADMRAGECAFRDVATAGSLDRLQGRELGDQRLSATLYCRGIEAEGWQQPGAFWHKLVGPVTGDMATLLVFSSRRRAMLFFSAPGYRLRVLVDGEIAFSLGDGQCNIVVVRHGLRVVEAHSETWPDIHWRLNVKLNPDERVAVRLFFDEKEYVVSTSYEAFRPSLPEVTPEFFQGTALPATAQDVCRSATAPVVLPRR